MGCMSLHGMALVGALAVLATLASSSPAAKINDSANLTGPKQAREQAKDGDKDQGVNPEPEPPKRPENDSSPEEPPHVNEGDGDVSKPDQDIPKPGGGQSDSEAGPGAGGAAGSGGTAGVRTCEQPNTSITIRIVEKGSSAQFACKTGFTLYPKETDKVFAKDCKKQETLKDMTRTEEPATPSPSGPGAAGPSGNNQGVPPQASKPTSRGGTGAGGQTAAPQPVVYTLRADKKPSKKKLCYLCAQKGVSMQSPPTAQNYCAIYVESGAHTQLGPGLTFALMLPCVLAVL